MPGRFQPGDRVRYESQYNEHGKRVDETLYGTVVRTDSSGVEVQFDGCEGTDGIPDDSDLLEHAPSSSTPTSAESAARLQRRTSEILVLGLVLGGIDADFCGQILI